ncbi:MAG: hypothetical protein IKW51_03580 [Bacteroidales bacterium]|nr:hypothetical protein [Bacteroidales bacterium]
MMNEDDLKKYLPKYLSEENYQNLLNELKSFPDNINKKMYTSCLDNNIIFQGDGINNMPIIDLAKEDKTIKSVPVLIMSNTCDMDLANERMYQTSIMYVPIIKLSKYRDVLYTYCNNTNKVDNHIDNLKQQKITQIMYLPAIDTMEESLVFLDRVYNINNQYIDRSKLKDIRIFSFSDYGFYLFIFKLSVHFLRIQEKVNRGMYFY